MPEANWQKMAETFERSMNEWMDEGMAGMQLAGDIQKALDTTEWGDDFEAEVKAALTKYRASAQGQKAQR